MKYNQLFFIAVLVLLALATCQLKLVADYDAATADAIFETAKRIDAFYAYLLDLPSTQRQYTKHAEEYRAIEVELGSLVMRNKVRPLNEESTAVAETTLATWVKYKDAHRQSDTYKDALAKLHRKRMARLLVAMAVAEEAKRIATEPEGE